MTNTVIIFLLKIDRCQLWLWQQIFQSKTLCGANLKKSYVRCLVTSLLKTEKRPGQIGDKDRRSRYIDRDCVSHNSPSDRARKVLKPSTDSASLLVSTENIF